MYMHQVSAGRERRRAEAALLDDRYLGPSLYGFQLAAFLSHFDRSQVLVIASEVLRDRLAERLSADRRRFEDLLGHQVPDHWRWSAPVPA